jgi:hypothetical protein
MATRNKAQKAPADASIVVRARSVESVPVDALKPYGRNARTHSESQLEQLVGTIRKLGFNDPLLVDESNMILSGHGRWEAAKRLGMVEVPCVRTEGMTDTEKRQAILAFNRIAQNAGWDDALLSAELTALADVDIDLGMIGFEPDYVSALLESQGESTGDTAEESKSIYSRNIHPPIYEPSGPKPELSSLYDPSKFNRMVENINASNMSENEKAFLRAAATRHIAFRYDLIANYYAQSEPATQRLMEDSALVIIDFHRAIELGFVRAVEKMTALVGDENDEVAEE